MPLDWQKCMVCQEATKEALKCPLNMYSHGSPESNREPYKAFLSNFNSFKEANALPVALKFDDIDVETLVVNNASWHKSCHLKFSTSKVLKAQERSRKSAIEVEEELPVQEETIPKIRRKRECTANEECRH